MADTPQFMPTGNPAPASAPAAPQGPSGAAATQGQPGQFAVRGSREDEIKRQNMIDPGEVTEVTQEEQEEYDDWVSRLIAMISDSRVPGMEGAKSPSDSVLEIMSNSQFSVPQALSEGAAATMMLLYTAAKRSGKEYSPDVMFHGTDELIGALYMLGAAKGIFDGASEYAMGGHIQAPQKPEPEQPAQAAPAEMPKPRFMEPPTATAGGAADEPQPPTAQATPASAPPMQQEEAEPEGDFTDDEYAMMGEAILMTVELFGKKLLDSGQLTEEDRKSAEQFWQSQIQKEAETGQLDGAMFDDMDVDAIRNQMMKGGA